MLLINIFEKIEDKRINRKKLYPLIEIIVVAIGTILCGGETYVDMNLCGNGKIDFFKKILPFKNGIPSEDTFERVFKLINPKQLQGYFSEWVEKVKKHLEKNISDGDKKQVAIDGKTIRGSKIKGKNALQILSAFATEYGLAIGSKAIEKEKNEITEIPNLLRLLELEGTIITSDAIACQTDIVNQIVEQNGDFVITLKGNQGNLHDDVKTFFNLEKDSLLTPNNHCEIIDKDHGRIEKRNYFFTSNIGWLIQRNPEWTAIKSIGSVTSTRIVDGKTTVETRFFISSLTGNVSTFANAVRDHWSVENCLHYLLDVVFREDNSRVRDKIAAENLNTVRKIALNLLVLSQQSPQEKPKKKLSKRSMRVKAAYDNTYLESLFLRLF
jgi:predicted transposase YbfD/YdcC